MFGWKLLLIKSLYFLATDSGIKDEVAPESGKALKRKETFSPSYFSPVISNNILGVALATLLLETLASAR